jgi:hypothetical protein
VFLYYASVSAAGRVGDGGGLPAEGEDIEIIAVGLEELLAMVDNGTIIDAKTLLGAGWLERRRRAGTRGP